MEAFPLFDRIDAFVDASITGVLKPHPVAYKQALLEMDEDAESVVFVDDQPINIAGSEAVGIPSVWFDVTNPVRSVAATVALLGLD
ncbi:MAG: HAD-IA family hydrolase [Acidimicrobiales bacterium]|nr:HAD-IA family hydrolase [Acidimicrobiales bacterium]